MSSTSRLGQTLGFEIRTLRRTLGWTQKELAGRAGVSQTLVSAVERGVLAEVPLRTVERAATAMGARVVARLDVPFLADRSHQRDAAHARCVAFVADRLGRAGWRTTVEVQIGGDRARGWIDVLAWHRPSGVLLVVEVKTELHDLGAIERTMGWYERAAWRAARERGWRPETVLGVLLVLATETVEARARDNRMALAGAFPGRAEGLRGVVGGVPPAGGRRRFVAAIDPMSRRVEWLRPLRIDGRRTAAPYPDYAGFIRAREARRRAHRR